ncbi:MAG: cytochrome P450 [Betaproteobacteria bacterium]
MGPHQDRVEARCVKEAMRLYPLYPIVAREVNSECELGGYRLATDSNVAISVWAMHRDPRNLSNPEAFDPDRWTDELLAQLPKLASFSFGGGPRQCPFKSYGMLEYVLLLATIAQKYRVRLAPGERAAIETTVNGLLCKGGLNVIVERRRLPWSPQDSSNKAETA